MKQWNIISIVGVMKMITIKMKTENGFFVMMKRNKCEALLQGREYIPTFVYVKKGVYNKK